MTSWAVSIVHRHWRTGNGVPPARNVDRVANGHSPSAMSRHRHRGDFLPSIASGVIDLVLRIYTPGTLCRVALSAENVDLVLDHSRGDAAARSRHLGAFAPAIRSSQVQRVDGISNVRNSMVAASEDVECVADNGPADVIAACRQAGKLSSRAGFRVEDGDGVDGVLEPAIFEDELSKAAGEVHFRSMYSHRGASPLGSRWHWRQRSPSVLSGIVPVAVAHGTKKVGCKVEASEDVDLAVYTRHVGMVQGEGKRCD